MTLSQYQKTINFLYKQLPQYQKEGGKAYKPSLENIKKLCSIIGNPHKKIKTIHIAGTNGKGSTSSFLASILIESKYKVGLFTSPHLLDFRERITINRNPITKQYISDFVNKYKDDVVEIKPSFFEWTTAIAFHYFDNNNVDVAVIETGLGGRLDSSNIISPIVSVITTIGLDHTKYLGNTIKDIAFEKGGIIKHKTTCILGYGLDKEAVDVLYNLAEKKESNIIIANKNTPTNNSGLIGEIQKYNIATVIETIKYIKNKFPKISEKTINLGIKNVTKNTLIRGRWEVLSNNPTIIADIAHNTQAVKAIISQLNKEKYNNLYIIWGMVEDKDAKNIVKLLPNDANYFLCMPKIERAMKLNTLSRFFEGKKHTICNSCEDAYKKTKELLKKDDLLLISGSNFVVAEIIENNYI